MSRPLERFCVWGHDTEVVGRYVSNNTCKECSRQTRREQYRKRRQKAKEKQVIDNDRLGQAAYDMRRNGGKLPAKRLRVGVSREYAGQAWASRWNCDIDSGMRAAYRLWGSDRITVDCADRWCVALGTHLAIVYPEVYYAPRASADIPLIPDDEFEAAMA